MPSSKCNWCNREIIIETGNYVNDDGDFYDLECYMQMTKTRQKATKFREWATNYVLAKVWTKMEIHFRQNMPHEHGECNCDGCRVIKLWINSILEGLEGK